MCNLEKINDLRMEFNNKLTVIIGNFRLNTTLKEIE
jgi:hypothetical protein